MSESDKTSPSAGAKPRKTCPKCGGAMPRGLPRAKMCFDCWMAKAPSVADKTEAGAKPRCKGSYLLMGTTHYCIGHEPNGDHRLENGVVLHREA